MFLNQNGVTFTKKVIEDLGYPAFVLCLLDSINDDRKLFNSRSKKEEGWMPLASSPLGLLLFP